MTHARSLRLPRWTAVAAGAMLLAVAGLSAAAEPARLSAHADAGKVVVADRSSGTVTVIDAGSDTVVATLDLLPATNPAEPMYVWYSPIGNRFFAGDRANDRVVAFDADSLEMVGDVPAGRGVFHMWGSTAAGQLWVNNDLDNTTTVINLRDLTQVASVPTPADLVAMGGKPHDVILSPDGRYAYVTVLGLPGPNDFVVQFDTASFAEIGRAAVGKDPHVALFRRNTLLYVPSQSGDLHILDRVTLDIVDVLSIPGAHGAGMPNHGRFLYTTNLPGGGTDALWIIDTHTNQIVGDPVDSPYPVPHNIALTPGGGKLYLTHSGANDKVSVYAIKGEDPTPILIGEVTTGMNPFGLAWVP